MNLIIYTALVYYLFHCSQLPNRKIEIYSRDIQNKQINFFFIYKASSFHKIVDDKHWTCFKFIVNFSYKDQVSKKADFDVSIKLMMIEGNVMIT